MYKETLPFYVTARSVYKYFSQQTHVRSFTQRLQLRTTKRER